MSDYCTLTELRAYLGFPSTSTSEDVILKNAIVAASRYIDAETGRRFYSTSSDETRYYTADDAHELCTDDLLSITTLQTDDDGDRIYENTWQAADYELLPYNAGLDAKPYTSIGATPLGGRAFPKTARGVKVVGRFGYCETNAHPLIVKQACLILASYLYKLKDNPLGISANVEVGTILVDPKVSKMVNQMLWTVSRRALL